MKDYKKYLIPVLCAFFLVLGCSSLYTKKETLSKSKELNPNLPPSSNFNLTNWYLSVPIDNGAGKATSIYEDRLNSGFQNENFFYTGSDGGMVFKCPVKGNTTTTAKTTRVELREMLRKGNTTIKTTGVNKNNWVLGSAPLGDLKSAAAYDGEMNATLSINQVTTTGKKSQIGRVVIGQIHANTDEPIRLYYRKLRLNELGCINFAHEMNNGEDTYYEMIGDRSSTASNPKNGIALNEKFSYTIKVIGNKLWVTILKKGAKAIVQSVDMSHSGYDKEGQYLFFKAGIYNQNNTGDATDYVQVTFYKLTTSHTFKK